MSALPPQPGTKAHRQHACGRKRRYPDHVSALAFAIVEMERGAPKLDTYRCGYCAGWHLAKAAFKRRKLFARKAP